ncbi:hypothetical protein R7X16_22935, partial [Vibrio sp. 818]|uniref:hypothetical protein n=1 Tax=Vibrio sp. 818 TaxID=3074617 RepID=UPI0029645F26
RLQPCLLKIYSNMVVLWGNYEGIPQNKVAILLGQPISSNQAEKWGVSVEQNCSLESVGVMIDEVSKVIAVSKPLEGALLCPVLPIDDVFFKSYNWSL